MLWFPIILCKIKDINLRPVMLSSFGERVWKELMFIDPALSTKSITYVHLWTSKKSGLLSYNLHKVKDHDEFWQTCTVLQPPWQLRQTTNISRPTPACLLSMNFLSTLPVSGNHPSDLHLRFCLFRNVTFLRKLYSIQSFVWLLSPHVLI